MIGLPKEEWLEIVFPAIIFQSSLDIDIIAQGHYTFIKHLNKGWKLFKKLEFRVEFVSTTFRAKCSKLNEKHFSWHLYYYLLIHVGWLPTFLLPVADLNHILTSAFIFKIVPFCLDCHSTFHRSGLHLVHHTVFLRFIYSSLFTPNYL